MATSVESLCTLLVRSRLLATGDVESLQQRWRRRAGTSGADAEPFARWLVHERHLTDYQADLLLRGRADHFFLDQYKLLERIGKGRMAGVYKAVHELGQIVAVKVLPPSKAKDPELLARFQREARLALRLKHPNVVRTFQTGLFDGLHYLVMEYLDGETLDEVLRRRGKLPPAEAARLVHQALLGLEHLHQMGLVHRDVNPSNLMLTPRPRSGRHEDTLAATVKILDIGLGRALFDEGAPGADPMQLTNEGALLGTPAYLAPEQARDARTADIRADLYSLGCVFYHTLTGNPPFADANPVRQLIRHATEPPAPLRTVNASVPDGLQKIVDKMLAKDPAQRYPTPERAAQALQEFLAGGDEPAGASGSDARMGAYLAWLNSQAGVATEPPRVAASPAAIDPAKPPPIPRSGPPAQGPAPPRAHPLPPSPPQRSTKPAAIDVELVPVAPTANANKGESEAETGLSRRDWLLFSAGAAAAVAAIAFIGGLYFGMAYLFRPKKMPDPEPDEAGPKRTE